MTIQQIQAIINDGLASGEFTREQVQQLNDGVHSFADLYNSRMIWNALAFQMIHDNGLYVYKSRLHNDGGSIEGFFVVGTMTRFGQVTQHYPLENWDLFRIPEVERLPWVFDGHTKNDVLLRISQIILLLGLKTEMQSHAEDPSDQST